MRIVELPSSTCNFLFQLPSSTCNRDFKQFQLLNHKNKKWHCTEEWISVVSINCSPHRFEGTQIWGWVLEEDFFCFLKKRRSINIARNVSGMPHFRKKTYKPLSFLFGSQAQNVANVLKCVTNVDPRSYLTFYCSELQVWKWRRCKSCEQLCQTDECNFEDVTRIQNLAIHTLAPQLCTSRKVTARRRRKAKSKRKRVWQLVWS